MLLAAKKVFIVPHTHWDREWYLPFQRFRYQLVGLIDELLKILETQDYVFMLDGQTIVLEDYMEIRPDKKDELLQRIKEGKIAVGPWYLLPDEWLVGGESLIRNLEYSHDLAEQLNIPLMDIAYLPDQFGHTSAMPQMLGDLTSLKTAVLWRGVPPDVGAVPFVWRSHENSRTAINGVYLPAGYGNASMLPEDYDEFVDAVHEKIAELESFSPVPVYLLMNGSDHRYPQPFAKEYSERMANADLDVRVSHLKDFITQMDLELAQSGHARQVHVGEFRSPSRAPLLQDTYSARMWIKQWNQKTEDYLTRLVEPVWTYLASTSHLQYPKAFLRKSWMWLLRNHPHDSICGCSVDQTHEEMRARFSWAESIGDELMKGAEESIHKLSNVSEVSSVLAFVAGGSSSTPVYMEFTLPGDQSIHGLRTDDGETHEVQPLTSREDVFMDTTIGMRVAKMGMRLLPGRKLMDFYINGVEYHDGDEPGLLELRFIADRHPIGDFDMEGLKEEANRIIGSKKYKKIHLIAARPTQRVYAAVIPLKPWAFSKLAPIEEKPRDDPESRIDIAESRVETPYYAVSFNKDGSLDIINKATGLKYQRMHTFEDYGDRGDEYTFSGVEPNKASVRDVKRTVISKGPIVAEIRQTLSLGLYASLDTSRDKRTGSVEVPITSIFRFYRDTPRIEVKTKLCNKTEDHRLRVCFNLPFTVEGSLTSTHFGYMERSAMPEEIPSDEELERMRAEYPERPSGVQPQKGFIRVQEEEGGNALTVINRGLPEVEVADGNHLALTLVRCVGWLSRSDIPERPMHAGPGEETPGAQEVNENYEFDYGFVVHSKSDPVATSADHSDVFQSRPLVMTLDHAEPPHDLFEPIVQIRDPAVRLSSVRRREDSILVTLHNIENREVETEAVLAKLVDSVTEVRIDGTTIRETPVTSHSIPLSLGAREIKMYRLSMK